MTALGLSDFTPYEEDQQYKVARLRTVEWWASDQRRGAEFDAPAAALQLTRQMLRRTFNGASTQQGPPLLVWVSRQSHPARRVTNEVEVLEAVKAAFPGLQLEVWRGTEGMRAAATLFGAAALVAGPHGAGLANILFCDHCRVLELTIESAQMRYFGHLATALGMPYEPIVALPGFRQEGAVQPQLVIDGIQRALPHLIK